MKYLSIIILALLVMVDAVDAQNFSLRKIKADLTQVEGKTIPVFKECIGAGRAAEGLRADGLEMRTPWQINRRQEAALKTQSAGLPTENNARQGAYISGRVEGLQVHNNVFYADENFNDVVILKLNRWTVYPNGASFRNNIFYFKGTNTSYAFTNATNVSFDHNIYFGVKPPTEFRDKTPIETDPKLIAVGKGKDGYRVLPGSPAINAGVLINNYVGKDYYGNKIEKGTVINIGIDNTKR